MAKFCQNKLFFSRIGRIFSFKNENIGHNIPFYLFIFILTKFGTQKIAGTIAACQNTTTFQKQSTFLCSQILVKILLWMIASPTTSQNWKKKTPWLALGYALKKQTKIRLLRGK